MSSVSSGLVPGSLSVIVKVTGVTVRLVAVVVKMTVSESSLVLSSMICIVADAVVCPAAMVNAVGSMQSSSVVAVPVAVNVTDTEARVYFAGWRGYILRGGEGIFCGVTWV